MYNFKNVKEFQEFVSKTISDEPLWEEQRIFSKKLQKNINISKKENQEVPHEIFQKYFEEKEIFILLFSDFIDFLSTLTCNEIIEQTEKKKINKIKNDTINKYKDDLNDFKEICSTYEILILENNLKVISNNVKENQKNIKDFNKILEDKQNELNETESKILTHVLTLLGVFTTIITIIITTISTTASWLNNSNNSSFMIALLLPASIILLSTFLLLFMIKLLFLYKRNISKEETNKFLCRKNVILILIFVGIMVLFGSSIVIAISKDKEPKHSEPIIIEDYVINQEENKLIYTYNEVEFTIKLNYDLIHEDGLHYCTIHNKFE